MGWTIELVNPILPGSYYWFPTFRVGTVWHEPDRYLLISEAWVEPDQLNGCQSGSLTIAVYDKSLQYTVILTTFTTSLCDGGRYRYDCGTGIFSELVPIKVGNLDVVYEGQFGAG